MPVMPLHRAQRIGRVLRPEQASLHGERSLLHAAGAGMADVYLADNHAMMRDGLKAVLESAGHRVVGQGADPADVMSDVQRLAPQLLVLELAVGAHQGLDLLAALRRRELCPRVIVLTVSAQPRDVAGALRLGALGYLLKHAPASELLQAVESVLRGRRHLSPEVADLAVQGLTEAGAEPAIDTLSRRERQIIASVVRGRSSREIAGELHLSSKTVDSYRSRLMAKLGVSDVPALVRYAIRAGLIDVNER